MTIGQRIKKILDNQGMTQKELAEKAGVTELAISITHLKDRSDVHISEHVLQSKANRQRPMHMTHLADCGKKGEKGEKG